MPQDLVPHCIVFDCEFLTDEGAPGRFWCGPHDPDPVVAQIGLVKIGLQGDFPVLETARIHIVPRDRQGARVALTPLFTRLTGITEATLDREGRPLGAALEETARFADGARLWSWGKDEFNLVAISAYVEGIAPPIPATRFGNATSLLLKAGMPYADICKTPSNRLADYYGLADPARRDHDALDDALSVAHVLRHLLARAALTAQDLA